MTATIDHPAPVSVAMPKHPPAQGSNSPTDQRVTDAHNGGVGGGLNSPAAKRPARPSAKPLQVPNSQTTEGGHHHDDNQVIVAALGPILRDPLLGLLADSVDDLERVRIAMENRFRQLTRDVEDVDGQMRGFGLSTTVPEVRRVSAVVDGLFDLEKQAVSNLEGHMRTLPLWSGFGGRKEAKGVGQKQLARLLAVIGDPYWNDLHDRPRTVSQLRSYCGFGDAARQVRRRGQKSNWSDDARKRTWLIAKSCLIAQGDYAQVYYAAREKYADAVHAEDCVRCGPAGKPALAGTPLSAGHQKARAFREIAKAVLKDLWIAARDIHMAAASATGVAA